MLGEAFIALMMEIIIVIVPVVAGFIIKLLNEKIGNEKMQKVHEAIVTKRDLAESAVRFAEQVYSEMGGQKKYDQAVTYLVNRSNENGIKLSDEEVNGLIESAVQMMNSELKDGWIKSIK